MRKLIYFEIKKNFLVKHILFFLIAFLILNFLYFHINSIATGSFDKYFLPKTSEHESQWKAYNELHNKLDGKLTKDKVEFIIAEYNRLTKVISEGTYSKEYQEDTYTGYIFGDLALISKYFYEPVKSFTYYEENNKKIVDKARENVEFYKKYGNDYEVSRNKFIVDNYSERKITEFYEVNSWQNLFDYYFSDLLILLILIVSLIPMYINEKRTKMDELILSCNKGKFNYIFVKITATFLFVLCLVTIFSIENFIMHGVYYDLSGGSMPLYAVEKYRNTPLNLSLVSFYLLLSSLKILGLFLFSLILLVLSVCFRKVIMPFIISSFTMVILLFISGFSSSIYLGKSIMALSSPFTLLMGQKLFYNLLSLSIFDLAYLRSTISIMINLFIMIILMFFLKRFSKNQEGGRLKFYLSMKSKKICSNKKGC